MDVQDLELIISLKLRAVAECKYLLAQHLKDAQHELEEKLNSQWTDEILIKIKY